MSETPKRPKTIAEAIGMIALSNQFKGKTDKHIKDILKDHIDLGSSEYRLIREDAISTVVTFLLGKIAKGETDSEWYQEGVSSFGKKNCALTRYMYTSVGNYARTRFDRWSDAKAGARVRDVVPFDVETTDGGVEDWLSRKVAELPNSDVESDARKIEIKDLLQKLSLPTEVVSIVLLKCDGLTYGAIGKTLGLSQDAVRMKLNRAKPSIRTVLG
jgi:RNA polymerase sigma factor (sigma-70 family)